MYKLTDKFVFRAYTFYFGVFISTSYTTLYNIKLTAVFLYIAHTYTGTPLFLLLFRYVPNIAKEEIMTSV